MADQNSNKPTEPKNASTDENQLDAENTEPEKSLFSWKAQARPFQRKPKEFWVRVLVIGTVFGFVLYLIEGAMPVILLIAIIFFVYILTTVEPEQIEYKITTYGVRIADNLNPWDAFTRFWFSKRFETEILVLETFNIAGRLELVINPKDKADIQKTLNQYIVHEEAPPTQVDKLTNWVSDKLQPNTASKTS